MKKLLTFTAPLVAIFLLSFTSGFAQLSEGGVPYSFTKILPSLIHSVTLPPVDVAKLLAEDKIEESKGLPFRFGIDIPVNYNLENSGTWYSLPDGSRIWRLEITSPGASTINIMYNDYWLPRGAKFYVYNRNKTEVIGAFTNRNNKVDGQFATGIVRGESMILEYYEPGNIIDHGIISVSYVIHGYKDVFTKIHDGDDFGGSGACNINVNCPVGAPWSNEKRAAAMILLSNGTRWCSGSMINNIRQDLKKYFLTANHCGSGQNPGTWLFMFRYESPNCTNIDGPLNYTIHGSTLKANNAASDFYLVEFLEAIPDSFQVHYAGFNATEVPATNGVGIHHPDGDIKKISFAPQPFEHDTWSGTPPSSHWRVRWTANGSTGVTEPGSSGSPIYDQNHRIMGQLHGGPSSCTASDKSDLYGKVSMSWDYGTTPSTRLKDWLDPDNTGTRIIDGWDPSMGNPDTVAPTKITNLAVGSPTSNSLLLTWSAPLDTSFGGVLAYDIRKSNSPITDTITFLAASQVIYAGSIGAAGTPQSHLVNNLAFSTNYYFAIRSKDRWNNWSLVSNGANATTWAAPIVSVTPDSMHHNLTPGAVFVDSLMLSNNSSQPSSLNYSVSLENNNFPNTIDMQLVPFKKESEVINYTEKENPPVSMGQSVRGSGGPDAFGYKWIDSDDPNGPQYIWEDISVTGTEVTSWVATGTYDPKDEGIAGPFALGFNFKFYGQIRDAIHISTDGVITFSTVSGYNIFTNASIPTASNPNEMICAFWDDLDGRTQGKVYTKQEGTRFIVQFNNWQKYTATGSLTFQMVLYAGGKIMFYYNTLTGAALNSCTVGIEDGAGTVGLQVVKDAAYLHDALAIKFAAEPDWLTSNNPGGILNSGNSAALKMTYRSEDFPAGDYHMDVMIASNDPVTPLKRVPVTMKVSPVPVELTSLLADAVDDNIILKWETATELNNSGFSVERKSSVKTNWSEVSFVKGAGNSLEKKVYTFRDKNVPVGKYSYRLRQVDFDGTIKFSPVVEVDVKTPEKFALLQNYPNPFNPDTRIKFSLPVKSPVRITIYSALGEKVAEPFAGNMEAGFHELLFSASKISSGTYFYRIEAGSFVETKKMTIMK